MCIAKHVEKSICASFHSAKYDAMKFDKYLAKKSRYYFYTEFFITRKEILGRFQFFSRNSRDSPFLP